MEGNVQTLLFQHLGLYLAAKEESKLRELSWSPPCGHGCEDRSSLFWLTGSLHSAIIDWKHTAHTSHQLVLRHPWACAVSNHLLLDAMSIISFYLLSANTFLFQDGKQTEVGYIPR